MRLGLGTVGKLTQHGVGFYAPLPEDALRKVPRRLASEQVRDDSGGAYEQGQSRERCRNGLLRAAAGRCAS